MQRVYNILTAIIAFTGCLSIIISGETNPLLSLLCLGVISGYYRFLKGKPPANRYITGGLSIITLLIFILDSIFLSKDYFIAVAHLTIIFQVIKSFDLKEPWDYLQVYFMVLLQLIIASELVYSILFGIVFIAFLLLFVAVAVFSHFIREDKEVKIDIKKPIIYISLLTIFLTVFFFISIPRLSGSIWGKYQQRNIRSVGFSNTIDFGSYEKIMLDPTVVMRVEIDGSNDLPYYWRGITLNYFDGESWQNTHLKKEWISRRDGRFIVRTLNNKKYVMQRIFVEPMDNDVMFGLDSIFAIESRGFILYRDEADALYLPEKKGRRIQYIVYSSKYFRKAEGDLTDYLQIPEGFGDVIELSNNLTKGLKKDYEKAIKIERYLKDNFIYSLDLQKPQFEVNPIKEFLFNSKKGFCEHYATAMVLMLRAIGIPSRIVTGFAGGELNEYGGYLIVRQSHAHSWVEAVIDGYWLTFDPTPKKEFAKPSSIYLFIDMLKMKWHRYVIGYSLYDQRKIVRKLNVFRNLPSIPEVKMGLRSFISLLIIGLILTLTIIVFYILKNSYKYRYDFATKQYLLVRKKLKGLGIEVRKSSSPYELENKALSRGLSDNITDFIRLYEKIRFGNRKIQDVEKIMLKELTQKLLKEIRLLNKKHLHI